MKRRLKRYGIVLLIAGVLAAVVWPLLVRPAYTNWLIHQATQAKTQESQHAARQKLYEQLVQTPARTLPIIYHAMKQTEPTGFLILRSVLDHGGHWTPNAAAYPQWLMHSQALLADASTITTTQRFIAQEWARFAGDDPSTWAMIEDHFAQNGPAINVLQSALDQQGRWSFNALPASIRDPWLQYLAASDQAHERQQAANLIARTPHHLREATAVNIITHLLQDDARQVRQAALRATGFAATQHGTALQSALTLATEHTDAKTSAEAKRILRWIPTTMKADASNNGPTQQTTPPLTVDLNNVWQAVDHRDAARRALACYLLVQSRQRVEEEDIQSRLGRFNDDQKRAGALLAAMTGVGIDTVDARELQEDQALVREVQRMALWAHDRYEPMETRIAQLILHEPALRHEALALLLQRRDRRALDALLAPYAEPPRWAIHLLYADRWVYALQDALPQNAPRLAVSDQAAENERAFREVVTWYRVHRDQVWSEPRGHQDKAHQAS